jgi:hypothetical protein
MKELFTALVSARSKMPDPRKSATNPAFRSKFVPRDEALDAIIPTLNGQGLMLVQTPIHTEDGVGVSSLLIHVSGQSLDLGTFTVNPAKNDPQGFVAATTYASRCALMLTMGLAGDEDDDGNGISAKNTAVTRENAPQAKKTTKATPTTTSEVSVAQNGLDELRALWKVVRDEMGTDEVKMKAFAFKEMSKPLGDLTDAEAVQLAKAMRKAYGCE